MVFFSNPRSSVQAKVGTFIYKYDKHGRPRERSPAPPGFQLDFGKQDLESKGDLKVIISSYKYLKIISAFIAFYQHLLLVVIRKRAFAVWSLL